ncbi:uncharacterized protein LACBIDRAFT_307909 [Laccaria bicolor S238N-H82]|uniref:Predicted protein n=1 Tax=Laccaria bicolor (strain S238N-H82 / ATCC MYA-4686) TaxID=486041 RepID=B0E4L4_LACBS|nr:uncharacterized protein LACBIDRAFT_307909 [Laccaria bicolor S238N-H82]EDQ98216.1 predicted protein [Laccaria bicolor S238N-H82]|eukprot:XP_001891134.1 predicted protein [Laccaria bicolor S238N-H82]
MMSGVRSSSTTPTTTTTAMSGHLVHPNAELLQSATKGFNLLFSNNLVGARQDFAANEDPFHILGQGVCAFLEAALGMESGLMAEASRMLALSEAGTRKQMKAPKKKYNTRFPQGLEWEILNADVVVLLGMTHALRCVNGTR